MTCTLIGHGRGWLLAIERGKVCCLAIERGKVCCLAAVLLAAHRKVCCSIERGKVCWKVCCWVISGDTDPALAERFQIQLLVENYLGPGTYMAGASNRFLLTEAIAMGGVFTADADGGSGTVTIAQTTNAEGTVFTGTFSFVGVRDAATRSIRDGEFRTLRRGF